MQQSFSLQFRLTKYCNADCSYCCSNDKVRQKPISFEQFKKSVDFLANEYLPRYLNMREAFISGDYLGGEITTMKFRELERCVLYAREIFRKLGAEYRDGIQTNLISSPEKARKVEALFEGRVGTSVDNFTKQRTIGGSHSRYKETMENVIQLGMPKHPPAVLVVEQSNAEHLEEEYEIALARDYDLTLTTLYVGGRNSVTKANDSVIQAQKDLFDRWFMSSDRIILEPFLSMVRSKASDMGLSSVMKCSGCAHSNICTTHNLNLEPDGELYLCAEMADKGAFQIGNALSGVIYSENVDALEKRATNMPIDCFTCPHFQSCRGGCMQNSLDHTGDLYNKDPLCALYTHVYESVELCFETNDKYKRLELWLENYSR